MPVDTGFLASTEKALAARAEAAVELTKTSRAIEPVCAMMPGAMTFAPVM